MHVETAFSSHTAITTLQVSYTHSVCTHHRLSQDGTHLMGKLQRGMQRAKDRSSQVSQVIQVVSAPLLLVMHTGLPF